MSQRDMYNSDFPSSRKVKSKFVISGDKGQDAASRPSYRKRIEFINKHNLRARIAVHVEELKLISCL